MRKLRVSAIVPTCQRPALLRRALRSVAAQALAPAEIIVVDDGPRLDVTRRNVSRWGFGARVIANSKAKGVSGARNTGAELARGELLAFLDDDDEWLPGYLSQALARFYSQRLDMICADLVYRYDDGSECPGKTAPERLAPALFLTRNPGLIGSNFIVRRALYRRIGGFNERLPSTEDMDFGLRISLLRHVRYQPVHERLVRHNHHPGPRLSLPEGEAMRAGVRRFYRQHGRRMTPAQREEFRRIFAASRNGGSLR
jgi:glycosyltransferase involved in cell wall biosynthesis